MAKLPALTPKEVVRVLERAGFEFVRQKGSHRIVVKGSRGVTVPMHSKELRKGTLHKIIVQSGLSLETFLELR